MRILNRVKQTEFVENLKSLYRNWDRFISMDHRNEIAARNDRFRDILKLLKCLLKKRRETHECLMMIS